MWVFDRAENEEGGVDGLVSVSRPTLEAEEESADSTCRCQSWDGGALVATATHSVSVSLYSSQRNNSTGTRK